VDIATLVATGVFETDLNTNQNISMVIVSVQVDSKKLKALHCDKAVQNIGKDKHLELMKQKCVHTND